MKTALRQLQDKKNGVSRVKGGVQGFSKKLDSPFRGNDKLGLLYLVQVIKINPFKLIISPARIGENILTYLRQDDQFEWA
jgi:hypothetical protein